MKNAKYLALLVSILAVFSGCAFNKPSPATVVAIINVGTDEALVISLQQWEQKDRYNTKKAATDISAVVTNVLIPYLDNNKNLASNALNTILTDNLITIPDIPNSIKSAIQLSAVILDDYLPAPTASTYLTADQISYVRAFLTGLQTGSNQYLSGIPVNVQHSSSKAKNKQGKWLH